MDPRNPATSITKVRAGIPVMVFSQSNLYSEGTAGGGAYLWLELPTPFVVVPGNSFAVQVTPGQNEGIRSWWNWEERTQLVR